MYGWLRPLFSKKKVGRVREGVPLPLTLVPHALNNYVWGGGGGGGGGGGKLHKCRWRRIVEGGGREDQAPAGQSPRAAHLEATEREVISSSFAWPRC